MSVNQDKLRAWARGNYVAGNEVDEIWHPVIQDECRVMTMEAEDRKRRDAERIREVVEGVADRTSELSGKIVVSVRFWGSLPKTKKLTPAEVKMVMSLPEGVEAPVGGDKALFKSDQNDAIVSFIAKRQKEFASFGIPKLRTDGSHIVDFLRIPEIDELAARTKVELAALVESLIEVYPSQITPEATRLGPLFNPRDYRPVEALRTLFGFDRSYDWTAFTVPPALEQMNKALYDRLNKEAQSKWAEIEANGVLLLRETVAGLVGGLVESLTPKEGTGEKKKFYASSVTKITDFIQTFRRRNICNDAALEAEIDKMEALVKGIDLKAMSSDVKLREGVKKDMEKAQAGLQQLVVSASARAIKI